MLSGCRSRRALEAWAKEGCDAALAPSLLEHVRGCRSCWQFYTEVTAARKVTARAPVYRVSHARLQSIEVLLRSETQHSLQRNANPRRRRPWQWLAVAAAAILAGTAGVAAVRVGDPRKPTARATASAQKLPAVIVGLAAGARGHSLSDQPDAPYQLEDGQGEFDVGKTSEGRSFRVLAGKHIVEANRSHFRLTVANAELSRVEVTAGRVTVRLGDETVAALSAGQVFATAIPASSAAPARSTPGRTSAGHDAGNAPDDTAFAEAYRLFNAGLAEQAAAAFDTLLGKGQLDASRRADVLYWASQAHARAGNTALAETRARSYLSVYPNTLRAGDVALMLGDYANARGAVEVARGYYGQAVHAARPATAVKAREKLDALGRR